jgi:hypothetical protein
MFFLTGWALMLLMGILHLDVNPSIPNLGYWICTGIMLCVHVLIAYTTPSRVV